MPEKSGLGGGDIKLFSASGAWVGAEQLALLLMLACVSALVVSGCNIYVTAVIITRDAVRALLLSGRI